MNKKGFTLVELLAILVILVIISVFSIITISSLSDSKKNTDELYNTIYMATESYIYTNYDNYNELDEVGVTVQIYVIDLINQNYLKNEIINPKDGEKFDSSDYIKVTRNEDMTFSFEIE